MNRLVLIGNGFDLAHSLDTSYSDFISDFWKNEILELQNNFIESKWENNFIIVETTPKNLMDFFENLKKIENYLQLETLLKSYEISIEFKNKFLKRINNEIRYKNWVDIEEEYYKNLKEIIKSEQNVSIISGNKNYTIKDLNNDFNQIKDSLIDYLKRTEDGFDESKILRNKINIGTNIYCPIFINDLTSKKINEIVDYEYQKIEKVINDIKASKIEINQLDEDTKKIYLKINNGYYYKNPKDSLKELILSKNAFYDFDFIPLTVLLLNFNYTYLDRIYSSSRDFSDPFYKRNAFTKKIHIHGDMGDHQNPIIFGYGDELDEDYKKIENLNENKYLENVKSIKYLETDNYKKLLEFIESDEYQVYIMGHSCGISDRTLLNTIFEHDNCISIKPFYHKISESKDNFQDLVQNISRNFTDKVKMRDRVVNKTYCQPLS